MRPFYKYRESFKCNKIHTENLQILVKSSSSRTFTKKTANKTVCQCSDESLRVFHTFFQNIFTRTIKEQMSNVNLVISFSTFTPEQNKQLNIIFASAE